MTKIYWTTAASGTWGTASDWGGGVVPNSGTVDAYISLSGSYAVTLPTLTSDTVDSLTVSDASATLALLGTLALGGTEADLLFEGKSLQLAGTISGGTVDIAKGTLVDQGGVLSTAQFTLASAAVLALGGKTLSLGGTAALDGTMSGSNSASSDLVITGNAVLAGSTLDNKATLTDAGSIAQNTVLVLGATSSDATAITINAGATYNDASAQGFQLAYGTATVTNAGLFEATGAGTSTYDAVFHDTGTLLAAAGSDMQLTDGGTIGGTLTGAGEIDFDTGTANDTGVFTLSPSVSIGVGTLAFNPGSTVSLTSNLSISTVVDIYNGATLVLDGYTATLSGVDVLNGEISGTGSVGNTLVMSGSVSIDPFYAPNYIENDATLVDTGSVTQSSAYFLYLGDSAKDTSSLVIKSGALYDIAGSAGVAENGGVGSIANAGLFESTYNGTDYAEAYFVNSGTILSTAGSDLQLTDGGSIGGTLTGAGEIDFAGGTFTLVPTAAVNVATVGFDAGAVTLGSNTDLTQNFLEDGAVIALNGHNLTLGSGMLQGGGTITGTGTATVTGTAQVGNANQVFYVTGGATLLDAGTLDGNGSVYSNLLYLGAGAGDSATLSIASTGTYSMATQFGGNPSLIAQQGSGTVINAGLIESNSITYDYIDATLYNTGIIRSDAGALQLQAGGTIGGLLTGAGEIDFTSGNFTLSPSIVLAVGTLGFDGGTVALGTSESLAQVVTIGSSGYLALNGYNLTLSGATDEIDGYIYGNGTAASTLLVTGTARVNAAWVYGGAELVDAGTLTDVSYLQFGDGTGDAAGMTVLSGAVFDIASNGYAIYEDGSGTVQNAGLFEATGGGTDYVEPVFDNTGTVLAAGGTDFVFTAGGNIGGTLTGPGEIDLEGGAYTLAAGLVDNAGTTGILAGVTLAANFTDSGVLAIENAIYLNGYTATAQGGLISSDGGVYGPGTLVVAGAAATVDGLSVYEGAVLDDDGSIAQTANLYLGNSSTDSATLSIGAGAVYNIENIAGQASSIIASGTVNIVNAGLLEVSGFAFAGQSANIGAPVQNIGTIALSGGGTLTLQEGATNDGLITVANGEIVLDGSLATGSGASGVIMLGANGIFADEGRIATGQSVSFSGTAGTLEIGTLAGFAGSITGFAAGDAIDLTSLAANGFTYANNILTLTEATKGGAATLVGTLALGSVSGTIALVSDGNGGTDIVLNHPGIAFSNPTGSITTETWTGGTANWGTAADWSPASVPGANNIALITGTTSQTISVNTSQTIYELSDKDASAILQISAGSFIVDGGGSATGSIDVSGGNFDAATGYLFSKTVSLGTAGTLEVDSGVMTIAGGGTLAGAVIGAGVLDLAAGKILLNGSLALDTALVEATGATLTLGAALNIATSFDDTASALNLNTLGLTLAGASEIGAQGAVVSVSGHGSLDVTGTTQLISGVQFSGNTNLVDNGTVLLEDASLSVGTSATDTSSININAGGTFDIVDDGASASLSEDGNGALVNAGLLEVTGYGDDTQTINMAVSNTGTLLIAEGTLALDGGATLGGTVLGSGELYLGGNLTLTNNLSIAGAFADNGSLIDLNGHNLTLVNDLTPFSAYAEGPGTLDILNTISNVVLDYGFAVGASATVIMTFGSGAQFGVANGNNAYLGGPGTFVSAGTVTVTDNGGNWDMFVGNGVNWDVTGTVLDAGNIAWGYASNPDTATISVAQSGVFDITTDDGNLKIYDGNGGYSYNFNNAGLLEKTGGSYSVIQGWLTNTGTILSDSGILEIQNGGLGGVIGGGTGIVALTDSLFYGAATTTTTTTFASGAQFGVANGNNAYLGGPGTFVSAGTVTVTDNGGNWDMWLTGGINWDVTGTVLDAGNIAWGHDTNPDTATISVAQSGVFDITTDDGNLKLNDGNPGSSYNFNNAGLLEKTGGAYSAIWGWMTNTGTILSDSGILEIQNGALGGVIGGGTGIVALTDSLFYGAATTTTTTTFASGAQFGVAGGNNAYLGGPGTFVSAGTVTVTDNGSNYDMWLTGGINWDVTGTVLDAGNIALGHDTNPDTATISVAQSGVFDITTDDGNLKLNDGNPGSSYNFNNAGLLEKTGGAYSAIWGWMTNTGTILSDSGILEIQNGGLGGVIGGGTGIVALTDSLFYGAATTTTTTTFASGAQFGVAGGNNAYLGGPGTFVSAGTVTVTDNGGNYDMWLTGGINWDVTGTVLDAGNIAWGHDTNPDTATISVAQSGVFDITTDDGNLKINDGNGGYSYNFNNAGLLEKTGGSYSVIQGWLTNTGTILSDSGILEIQNGGLGGVIGGGTGIVALTDSLFYGAATTTTTTTFASGAQFGIAGGTNAYLGGPGTFVSAGTVTVTDNGGNWDMFVGNGVNWDVTGTVLDAGRIGLGFANNPDTATISVAQTGVFDVTTDDANLVINDGNGGYSYLLNNAGLLEKTGGNYSYIQAYVVNTGTILSDSGVLELQAGALGGVIGGGTGIVALDGYQLNAAAGTTVTTTFASGAQFGLANVGAAYLNGPGTLVSAGTVSVADWGGNYAMFVGDGVNWDVTGTVLDAGRIGLGFANNPDMATISVAQTGVFDVTTDDANLVINDGNGGYSYLLNNAGLLEKTGGSSSYIQAYVTNTGTVLAASGALQLQGGIANDANGTLTGGAWEASAAGTATSTLELLQDPSVTTDAANIVLSGTSAEIITGNSSQQTIEASLTSIAATGTLQNLGGHTYTGGATLIDSGNIILGGGRFKPNSLTITSGGTVEGFGTLAATTLALQNSGQILAGGGALYVTSNVAGTGTLGFAGAGDLVAGANIAAGQKILFSGTHETLTIVKPATMLGTLSGLGAGDVIDIANTIVTGASLSGTSLLVTLTGGAVLTETLSSAITGDRFAITSDGAGGSDLTLYREAVGSVAPSPLGFGNHHVGDTVTAGLTIANTQPADGFSEGLDASFVSHTGSIATSGSLTTLAAGSSGTLGVTLATAAAGSIAGSAVVTLSTDGTGTDGDPALSLGTDTVTVTGAVYAYASASLAATTIALGNVHVGAADTTKLVLTDSATNLAYTEALDASFSGTTGSVLDTGSVSLLAAGATNSTSLVVGLSTGTAGALSGTALLSLTSDGTGLDGLGTTALAGQTVTVTGSVYNYATASLAGTVSLGQHHVGAAETATLALGNIAAAGAYSEALDAKFSGSTLTSGSFTTAGTITTLAAGSSNATSLTVKMITTTAGAVAGNAYVTLTSDGTNIDGLGTTSLGVDTVAVTGTVFNYATASLGTTLAFGQGHVGVADSKTLSIKNSAATGAYSEGLDAKFTGTSLTAGSFTTGGTLTALAAGSSASTLAVTLAGAAGTIAGLATVGLTSDGTGIDTLASTALTSQTVAVTGTLFNYATASAATTLALGQHHVGDVVATAITLANSAAAGVYSEGLDASFSGTTLTKGSFTASGTVTTLAAGGTNASDMTLTLATGTAGTVAGKATLALKSDGTGIDTLASTALTADTLAVTGAVFNYATASLASSIVNFGIVHAGTTLSKALTIGNIAATGSYSEGLDVAATGSTGSAAASGTIALLKAGSTNSTGLVVSLANGGTSGILSGTEILALTSDGSGIDTLGTTALASQTITLTGTVDNYATAALAELAGNGTLTGSGNAYTLNLGNVQQGAGSLTAGLGVLNSATGLSDLLGGGFTIANASGAFTNSSFSTFSALGAGQEDALPSITLSGTNAGNFSETITLSSTGSNASGYSGTLANVTLTVTGNVLHTYSLTSGADTIAGVGPDVIVAQSGQLSTGDIINAGTGINQLSLVGGGTFDMRAPATLTGISIVDAAEAIGTAAQTLYLDAGFAGTVNVAPGGAGSSITIYGNTDSATINLGNGTDTVYVGSAQESINGGGGNDTFFISSGDTGATINGGTGINTLDVAGGSSFAMGANITNIATVALNELATQSSTLAANTLANLAIFGGNGTDTIILGAASQSVTTGTGTTTIDATAAQAGAAIVNNGAATLDLTTGGNATLNANDSFLTVSLSSATNLTLSAQSFITAIGSAGNDTITALASQQTLTGGAGVDTLIGYAGFGDTFMDTSAGLNGDTIQYFGGNDLIDITNLARAGASLTYNGNATAGTLSISSAGLGVVDTITLASGTNLSAALFHMTSDGHGGTYLG